MSNRPKTQLRFSLYQNKQFAKLEHPFWKDFTNKRVADSGATSACSNTLRFYSNSFVSGNITLALSSSSPLPVERWNTNVFPNAAQPISLFGSWLCAVHLFLQFTMKSYSQGWKTNKQTKKSDVKSQETQNLKQICLFLPLIYRMFLGISDRVFFIDFSSALRMEMKKIRSSMAVKTLTMMIIMVWPAHRWLHQPNISKQCEKRVTL